MTIFFGGGGALRTGANCGEEGSAARPFSMGILISTPPPGENSEAETMAVKLGVLLLMPSVEVFRGEIDSVAVNPAAKLDARSAGRAENDDASSPQSSALSLSGGGLRRDFCRRLPRSASGGIRGGTVLPCSDLRSSSRA